MWRQYRSGTKTAYNIGIAASGAGRWNFGCLHRCTFVPADEFQFGFLLLTSTSYFQLGSSSRLDVIKYPTCSNTCPLVATLKRDPNYDFKKNLWVHFYTSCMSVNSCNFRATSGSFWGIDRFLQNIHRQFRQLSNWWSCWAYHLLDISFRCDNSTLEIWRKMVKKTSPSVTMTKFANNF